MIYTFIVAFKDQTRHVLNSMMGYISLPAILQKIMQVNFHWFKKQISGWVASWIYDWIGVGSFRLVIGSGNSRYPLNQSAATSFFSHIKLLTCVSFDFLWNLHYYWSKLMITFLSIIFIVLKITLAFCTLIHSLSALYLFTFCNLFIYFPPSSFELIFSFL